MDQYLFPGALVDAGEGKKPILKIAQTQPLLVQAILPFRFFPADQGRRPGGRLPEKPFTREIAARISTVDRVIDAAAGTFGVIAEIPNPGAICPAESAASWSCPSWARIADADRRSQPAGNSDRVHPVRRRRCWASRVLHRHTLRVALIGLAVIVAYKLAFSPFHGRAGLAGLGRHLGDEWVVARQPVPPAASASRCCRGISRRAACRPLLPRFLPDDWKGGLVLLVDGVRAVELSRQHRRGADRRHDGDGALPRPRPHRLPRRDRRRRERRRLGQRRRRHHHDDDVDRRRVAALQVFHAYVAAVAGAARLRHPRRAPAAALRSRSSRTRRPASRVDWRRVGIVAVDPRRGDRRQRRRAICGHPECSTACR